MSSQQRHENILELLRRAERVDVAQLAAELHTSEVTIRRDLDELARLGAARRVRGGAISLVRRGHELPFAVRAGQAAEAKARIAHAAAGMIEDGEAVVVDTGTTGVAAATALAGRPLRIIALSVPAAARLWSTSTALIVPGGTSRPGEGGLTGSVTERELATFRADTFLLTCCGVSLEAGITAFDAAETGVKQAAQRSSRRTILLADSSKFGRAALSVMGDWGGVDVLVTDAAPDVPEIQQFVETGGQVCHV